MVKDVSIVCNNSHKLLVHGSMVHSAIRSMLEALKFQFVLCPSPDEIADRNVFNGDITVYLYSLEDYVKDRDKLYPDAYHRYWIWTDKDLCDEYVDDFQSILSVEHGRIVNVQYQEEELSAELKKATNLGRWYALIMSLYQDVEVRVSYQNLALLLSSIYGFIVFSWTDESDRSTAAAVRKLGVCYHDVLQRLEAIRDLFFNEPFRRDDVWDIMYNVLECEEFYSLLKMHFPDFYSRLSMLSQLYKYCVAIEMDKEEGM